MMLNVLEKFQYENGKIVGQYLEFFPNGVLNVEGNYHNGWKTGEWTFHYDDGGEFMYHNYIDGQWNDYAGGLIFGQKMSKQLGVFVEGKYNKYWNKEWYDFKLGVNYIIF